MNMKSSMDTYLAFDADLTKDFIGERLLPVYKYKKSKPSASYTHVDFLSQKYLCYKKNDS